MNEYKFLAYALSLSLIALQLIVVQMAKADELLEYSAFLEKVQMQNLDLKIATAIQEKTAAQANGIRLPDPMLSGIQLQPKTGDVGRGFVASQNIPFPTKILSNHASRRSEALAQEQSKLAKEQEVLSQSRYIYFSLWAAQEMMNLLHEKQAIIENHLKLARSVARSDSFVNVHLLKAESDLDMLLIEIQSAEQKLIEKQTDLAALINEDPSNYKVKVQALPFPKIQKIKITHQTPQIKSLGFNLESKSSSLDEAYSAWLPDFNFSYKQMNNSAMGGAYQEAMLGVSVPFLFFWQPQSQVKEAVAQKTEAQYRLEKQTRLIEADVENQSTLLTSLQKRLKLIEENLLPRAEKRLKRIRNIAPRDLETLQDYRKTHEAFPDLKIKALEIRVDLERAIAKLKQYDFIEGEVK